MKYIIRFALATLILVFVFLPIIVARWVWTFKYDDTFEKLPRGIFYAYRTSWRNLVRRMKGEPVFQTF